MKIFPLLATLALFVGAGTAADGAKGLRLFYCIHAERPCEETGTAVAMVQGEATAVAKKALSTKDDFIGFVDAEDTTLQFYVEESDSVLVDMPVPAEKGSYAGHLDRAHALKLIARLQPPLARYRAELELAFKKWE